MPAAPASRLALHLTLRWRHDVLAVRRVEAEGVPVGALAPIPCPPEMLGFVFARVSTAGPVATAPAHGVATVWRAAGRVEIVEGPAEIPLASGDVAELGLGDFVLAASAGAHETFFGARARQRRAAAVWGVALAALAHAAVLGLAAHDARASALAGEEDAVDTLRGLLATAEARARAAEPPPVEDGMGAGEGRDRNKARGDGRDGGGAKAAGDEGKMGDRYARSGKALRHAVPADRKNDPEPTVSREQALVDAASFGMIGLVAQGPAVPAAPFADPSAHGADAIAARGSMWAMLAGDTTGESGLALHGIGEGGGGDGWGIGLGRIGTLGHTDGDAGPGLGGEGSGIGVTGWWGVGSSGGVGDGIGIGIGHLGRRGGTHVARPPTIRCGCYSQVSGRLPPETIQRITRQNYGRLRACYDDGLRRNPSLHGRVSVRFVIGRDGAVSDVADGGSDLPDRSVVACVERAFYGIGFPSPEGGIVTVNYPVVFSPS